MGRGVQIVVAGSGAVLVGVCLGWLIAMLAGADIGWGTRAFGVLVFMAVTAAIIVVAAAVTSAGVGRSRAGRQMPR